LEALVMRLVVIAALLMANAGAGLGQVAMLRGFVLADSSEAPLPGAEVSISALALRTSTTADGSFRLGGIAAGTYMVLVRAIGYEAISVRLRFAPGDSLERDFLLVRAPTTIAPVHVTATGDTVRNPKMTVFESRLRAGTGRFVTRTTLDSMANRRVGDIIASRVTGATVVSRSSAAWVAARRGPQSLTRRQSILPADIARGADRGMCYAAVYLDGNVVYGGQPGEGLFDVNTLQASAIAGIEYYAGGSQVPVEINATMNTCGVLVIWTR
jgi:hypothetical protein